MNKKNKKIVIISILVVVIICIILLIYFNIDVKKFDNTVNEIIPEEEISDEQLRETTINVYFVDVNNEIKGEIRKIDSKNLINNPYEIACNILLGGTTTDGLKTCIPKEVKLNKIEKNGECIVIDLSKEFIENMDENIEVQSLAISQIVNTLTQFTEINAVKILIDGIPDQSFKDGNIKFVQLFTNDD